MSDVQRYAVITLSGLGSVKSVPSANGHFVMFEDYAALQQKLDASVVWRSGTPAVTEGSSERFWVTHRLKDGSLHVADLFYFNCPAPDDEDAFCEAEMTSPDGDPYWPEGWHDLCSHPDFDYFYQKSDLDVLAYAEFIKPEPAKDGE
ncbi:hypothetical protein [Pantoea sp. At-9b]|uniref:hypothetical protein n=1 Tax=Pantoea sp. (strain At-9b) TaxID=592316 RepID=UPI0001B3E1F6|nr:hypothetical protein [Pantoea sp. At-9b]ADU71516.1 hypothetical protein Pat9b_5359 [Pantoea sp. At-9b]